MPSTTRKPQRQPLTRTDVLRAVYESLIDAARCNRRFSDIIMDTRVMGASINRLNDTWRIYVAMPKTNIEAATIIERAIKSAVPEASAIFN